MSALFALFFSLSASALNLEVLSAAYLPPRSAPSCGLLHQRELERLKVIRELQYLTRTRLKNKESALIFANNLLTNKLFLPREEWGDDSVDVFLSVAVPEAMKAEMDSLGLAKVFLLTEGPGIVWQSLAGQLPLDFTIAEEPETGRLAIHYKIYLNILCGLPLSPPKVEWVPEEQARLRFNTQVIAKKIARP